MNPKKLFIIESALKLFSKKGMYSTSALDIANETGLAKSTVFYHFKTIPDLHDLIFKYYYNQITIDSHNGISKLIGTRRKLEHIWVRRARWGLKNPNVMRFLYTRYALEANNRIDMDREILKIIRKGIASQKLINYNPTYIGTLFYASSNSIILSLVGKKYYNKKKITLVNRAFISFWGTVEHQEHVQNDY